MTQYMQAHTQNLLQYAAPAALANEPAPGLSATYSFFPTKAVVEALEQHDWTAVEARQTNSRRSERINSRKHEVIFVDRTLEKQNYSVFSEVPRLILSNSHDGGAQFKLRAGLWRSLCFNGLEVSDGLIQSVGIRHSRRTIEEVVTTAQAFRANADLIGEHVAKFRETELTPAAIVEFARLAIALRIQRQGALVEVQDVLRPQREGDAGNDLWRVFNRTQEWLLKGGFPIYHDRADRLAKLTARPIKAIDESSRINTGLWSLAEQFSLN